MGCYQIQQPDLFTCACDTISNRSRFSIQDCMRFTSPCADSWCFCWQSCYALGMQITLEIPDELAAQAESRGMTPEVYVRGLIEAAAESRPLPLPLPRHRPRIDTETFLRNMAKYSEKIPQLPDEAFTRASIYQDHD